MAINKMEQIKGMPAKAYKSQYYLKNRDKINEQNRLYYKRKKEEDPEFYPKILKRNSDYYYRGGKKRDNWTPEEEEQFFEKIKRDIRACSTPLCNPSVEKANDSWLRYPFSYH
jgi:hypothetical protein